MVITLQQIFYNEWEDVCLRSHSSDLKRKAVHDNIWKLIKCKTPWMGLMIYQCPKHFEVVKVLPCTCKSRFCISCGYKATQVWLHKLMQRVLPCDHQHLVFALPCELRDLAKANRQLIFGLMAKNINAVIKQYLKKHKKLNYLPGIVALLHTFGSGLKWHIHFHVMITAGGHRDGEWIGNDYLDEDALKKSWKAKLLAGLRKMYRKGQLVSATGRYPGESFLQMLSEIYEKNWYAWIGEVEEDSIFSFAYIGRYAKRACISQKGIISYVPHKTIAWKGRSKKKEAPDICAHRATTREFIELLIQHIPDRYECQVYYYGLYSPYHLGKKGLWQKARKILEQKIKKEKPLLADIKELSKKVVLTFSKLMEWTHDIDPLRCPICGEPLRRTGIIFLNPGIPADRDILDNYVVKDYALVKKGDTG